MAMACAISIMYIERSERRVKNPYGSLAARHLATQPVQLSDPTVLLYVVPTSHQMVDKSNL